jgi:hypothetical protein
LSFTDLILGYSYICGLTCGGEQHDDEVENQPETFQDVSNTIEVKVEVKLENIIQDVSTENETSAIEVEVDVSECVF